MKLALCALLLTLPLMMAACAPSASDAVEVPAAVEPTAAVAQVVPRTSAPPTEVPPTEAPPTEVLPTEIPPTKVQPTEVPPTEVPPTPVPPTATPSFADTLPDLGLAPEIENEVWLNTDAPLRLADLRGKVVVVEFWTFGCFNCQNVLPYVKEWHAQYGGENFQLLSIHYPEFNYERDIENVRASLAETGVTYPVAIDNEGVTWRAYRQRYWPVWYVLDKQGHIRYKHIGEGGYEETQTVIEALLAEPLEAGQ